METRHRPKQQKMDIDFATWNVRTLNKEGALKSLLPELIKYKIAIAAIQETKWHNKGISDLRSHSVFFSGKDGGKREFGVAFVVNKAYKQAILDFKPVNERLCVIRIKTRLHNVSLINAHAPTEDKAEQIKEDFYIKLDAVYDQIPSNDIKILLGDMNAKIGKEEVYKGTIGEHSLHISTNDNGQRLIDFAISKRMVISSTFFPHKDIHKITWVSPNGKTFNQIDHVLVEKRGASHIMDVRAYRGACCGSDHNLVKVRYRSRIIAKQALRKHNTAKLNVSKLNITSVKNEYKASIETNLNLVEFQPMELNEMWDSLKTALHRAAEETIGFQPIKARNEWYDSECRDAVAARNEAHKEKLSRPTRAKQLHFEQLRREADKICRKKKRKWQNDALRKVQDKLQNRDCIRAAYKDIRIIRDGYKAQSNLCRR